MTEFEKEIEYLNKDELENVAIRILDGETYHDAYNDAFAGDGEVGYYRYGKEMEKYVLGDLTKQIKEKYEKYTFKDLFGAVNRFIKHKKDEDTEYSFSWSDQHDSRYDEYEGAFVELIYTYSNDISMIFIKTSDCDDAYLDSDYALEFDGSEFIKVTELSYSIREVNYKHSGIKGKKLTNAYITKYDLDERLVTLKDIKYYQLQSICKYIEYMKSHF
jgi:hypothetical protein